MLVQLDGMKTLQAILALKIEGAQEPVWLWKPLEVRKQKKKNSPDPPEGNAALLTSRF